MRRHGAAAERHSPDVLWNRPNLEASDPLGCKHPHQEGRTGALLELHSVRGKPEQITHVIEQ